MLVTPKKSIVEEILGTFYVIDHNKSYLLNSKESDQLKFTNLLTKQCFTRLS